MRSASLLLLLCLTSATFAQDAAPARAARFYAADLDKPLMELRNGASLIAACADRLKRACTKQQRALAEKARTLILLNALTLFPQRPAVDPAAGITKPRELKDAIAATRGALWREAIAYDRVLLARYGATLQACPNEDTAAFRASLDDMIRVDLGGFQSLSGDELTRASNEIAQQQSTIAAQLNAGAPEDCAAARHLGEHLMELMFAKLQRWSGEDARMADQGPSFDFNKPVKPKVVEPPSADVAQAIAGNFVSVIATELQLTAFPESEARIKALADEIEEPNTFQ